MNFKYKKYTFKNGLRAILVPISSSNVVTTMALFGVGSRYEKNDVAGISHVLEHMHYKGTKKRPNSIQISEFIESIGGEHNAFTGKEYTGYYAKVASKHLEKSFDFLADLLTSPLLDQSELEKEKNVIFQELDMYNDIPMEIVSSKFENGIFSGDSLGRDIIGTRKSIAKITSEDLINFRKDFYSAANTVIVVAGHIDNLDETVILLEKYFALKPGVKPEKVVSSHDKQDKIVITMKKTEQSHLVIGFRGVSYSSPDRYALKLLAIILGGSMSSRMFEEIREKRNLAYSIKTSSSSYLDTGAIETQAGIPHDKTHEAVAAIMGEYAKIKAAGATIEELDRAKEILSGRMVIALEDVGDLADHFAMGELMVGELLTPDELLKKYMAVTVNDIKNIAQKYFLDDKITMSLVGPWKKSDNSFINLLKI